MSYGDYPDLSGVKKILVIKMRQLGDVLLTGPVFQGLKNRLPDAQIDAYVYREAFQLLEGHPAIHELLGFDRKRKGLRQELAMWRLIRKKGYDLVINLTEGDRGVIASAVSGARIRVGFPPKGWWQKKVYTHTAKHCPSLRHTVERNLDVIRRIGIFPKLEERELFLPTAEWEIDGPYVVIHPTSRWRFKCWPKMRELAQELIRRGMKLVFTSGPDADEVKMVEEIVKDLDVINLSGKISLKQLAGIIDRSEFLICVDSLPFHMASALKKPVVAIFGPTSEVTWGAWKNEGAEIVTMPFSCRPCYQDGCGGSKRSDCIENISVERVLQSKVFAEIGAARV